MDDKSQVRLAKKQKKLYEADKRHIDDAAMALMKTVNGRKYLWWLLEIGRVNTQPFSTNALTTAFACGELNVGNQILNHLVQTDPALYVAMLKEHEDEHRERTSPEPDSGDGSDPFADTDDSAD